MLMLSTSSRLYVAVQVKHILFSAELSLCVTSIERVQNRPPSIMERTWYTNGNAVLAASVNQPVTF